MLQHKTLIESAFDNIHTLDAKTCDQSLKDAVRQTIQAVDQGALRVAEKKGHTWQVNEWIKQAILLYFRLHHNVVMSDTLCHYYDKVPLKYTQDRPEDFQKAGVRIVPGAVVRYGSHISEGCVIMPSFVNIGAFIDTGCMIDTWATVGSCAQIGKNVHLSGGAGIGGVLEPLQASPTIIEDNCFIGARCEVAEGVIIEEGAVLAMGTFISQSTKILDRTSGEVLYGRVPAGAVVVPGSMPSSRGDCHLNAAIIVKYVDEKTKAKTGINAILREASESLS